MEGYLTKNQAIHAMEQVTQPECFIEDTRKNFAKIIEELPPADAAPVVHAENVANAHPSEEFKCSKCGTYLVDYIELRKVDGVEDFYIYEFTDWNFCPKCGARMDGEENG